MKQPSTHWQKQHIFTSSFSKRQCNWDGAAFSSKIGSNVKNFLDSLCSSYKVPVFGIANPPLTLMIAFNMKAIFAT
jgi:hypothetical protein